MLEALLDFVMGANKTGAIKTKIKTKYKEKIY